MKCAVDTCHLEGVLTLSHPMKLWAKLCHDHVKELAEIKQFTRETHGGNADSTSTYAVLSVEKAKDWEIVITVGDKNIVLHDPKHEEKMTEREYLDNWDMSLGSAYEIIHGPPIACACLGPPTGLDPYGPCHCQLVVKKAREVLAART